MKFELDPLPYAMDALAPHLTKETLEFHYEKHHQTYMTNLKKLLEGKPEADKSLEEIIKTSTGGVFNNAAQVWNHDFYWKSMKPNGGGEPTGALADAIKRDFGSFADFKTQVRRGRGGAVRLRLGVAGERRRQAQDRHHRQRRDAADEGPDVPHHLRRVGTRVLHRLPQPARQVLGNVLGLAGELGFCGSELQVVFRALSTRSIRNAPNKPPVAGNITAIAVQLS